MASIAVTTEWTDPTSGLTTGTTYIVQNRSTAAIQFFEGPTFNAAANEHDGVMLATLFDGGAGTAQMRWKYDSANQVRIRLVAKGFGGSSANLIEFALAG